MIYRNGKVATQGDGDRPKSKREAATRARRQALLNRCSKLVDVQSKHNAQLLHGGNQ